jgi:NADH dehydrogenase
MPHRLFITGATGFVGTAVVAEALSRGFEVHALVRRGAGPIAGDVRTFTGDLFDSAAVDAAMAGCEAVVHLVGIIAERPKRGVTFERIHVQGTQAIVEAARRAGIKRYVQMSANGTRPEAVSAYHQTKWRAEQHVRDSALDWTIFRPSLIHGSQGEFMRNEAKWAKGAAAPWLFMPYFGAGLLGTGGAGWLQPIFVDDVARAFVDAIDNPKSIHQTYALGGDEAVSWPQMHAIASRAIAGRPRPSLAIPAWYATLLTRVVPAALLPFNRAQVQMSQEDNTTDLAGFERDFGWRPRPFSSTLATYAEVLR